MPIPQIRELPPQGANIAGQIALVLQRGAELQHAEDILRLSFALAELQPQATVRGAVAQLDHVIAVHREALANYGDATQAFILAGLDLGLEP